MAYSFAQLEGLWEQAGGSPHLAPVMAAIALAESGGNPRATGGVGEKGLWQINPHAWGSLATYDPLGNARAAVHVEKVQGLSAWSTFNSGAYKHFLHSAAPTGTGQALGTTTAGGRGSGGNATAAAEAAAAGKVAAGVGAIGKGGTGGGKSGLDAWLQGVYADVGLTAPGDPSGGFFQGLLASFGLGGVSDTAKALTGLAAPFIKLGEAIDWLFVPSHWIRIFAGIGGGIAISVGVYQLAHTGQGKPAALPVGIGLTGLGAVLLFVAFHNLDPNIKTVGELLADLQGKAQAGLKATTSPAAAVQAAGG